MDVHLITFQPQCSANLARLPLIDSVYLTGTFLAGELSELRQNHDEVVGGAAADLRHERFQAPLPGIQHPERELHGGK